MRGWLSHASRTRPVSATPTSSDGASATPVPGRELKKVRNELDNKPQLKGRFTIGLIGLNGIYHFVN